MKVIITLEADISQTDISTIRRGGFKVEPNGRGMSIKIGPNHNALHHKASLTIAEQPQKVNIKSPSLELVSTVDE